MKTFATLVNTLDSTNKTLLKTEAIIQFLKEAHEKDKLWFLALFTGKRPKRSLQSSLLKQWAMEVSQIPEWLFVESYSTVGDLGETIALILPVNEFYTEKPLHQWMEEIINLKTWSEESKKTYVLNAWNSLPTLERFIFNKLIGGSFRLGISSKSLINALAKYMKTDESIIAHSISGDWDIDKVNFDDLVLGKYINSNLSTPYPFCLAYPLDKDILELGNIDQWLIEYKWDGIRGQFIKRNGEIFIWSRGEELITDQFPELVKDLLAITEDNFVLDGEILVLIDSKVQNFTDLQKRLNRKNVSKKLLEDYPVHVYLYDLIELQSEDYRNSTLQNRRQQLENLFLRNKFERFHLSESLNAQNWEIASSMRANSRINNSEGLMIKSKSSYYHTGRKRGDWWKWKIAPQTIDAVLIYAQKGSGRRSGFYTDYTFAVRDEDKLITIAKAYSGLTDKEIQEVSRFVTKNAIEKFGPVRTVKPELVFEIAFEGIGYSSRHKSGIALRFPRILRWRRDKSVDEIDTLENVKKLIL